MAKYGRKASQKVERAMHDEVYRESDEYAADKKTYESMRRWVSEAGAREEASSPD